MRNKANFVILLYINALPPWRFNTDGCSMNAKTTLKMQGLCLCFYCALLFSIFFVRGANAETVCWKNGPDTRFENPKNWDQSRVPSISDTVLFDSISPFTNQCVLHRDIAIGALRFSPRFNSSFDFNGHFLKITGEFVDIRISRNVLAATKGGLEFCGSRIQHYFPGKNDVPAIIINSQSQCVFEKTVSPYVGIDSLILQSGILRLSDSIAVVCSYVGSHGGTLMVPQTATVNIGNSADFSGLEHSVFDGMLCFSGKTMGLTPHPGFIIKTLSIANGTVSIRANGLNAENLILSHDMSPCTLSLGAGLTHEFRKIAIRSGGCIAFDSSLIRFLGDTLDLSQTAVSVSSSDIGGISLSGTSPQYFIPNPQATVPSLISDNKAGTFVLKNGFSCLNFSILSGTVHLGTNRTCSVLSKLIGYAGGLDFGSSTLLAEADTVDFCRLSELTCGNGTIVFTSGSTKQCLIPKETALHPNIVKIHDGPLFVNGPIKAKKCSLSNGSLYLVNGTCEFEGFSAKSGILWSLADSLIINGNANFSDLTGLVCAEGPVVVRANDKNPLVTFSATKFPVCNLVLSALPSLEGSARIIAGPGIHLAKNVLFQWKRSADAALFDFRQNRASMTIGGNVRTEQINSGIDKGCILMGNGIWTFGGDMKIRNVVRDSSVMVFNKESGKQLLESTQSLGIVRHVGKATVSLLSPLSCKDFYNSDGILESNGNAILSENDVTITNGTAATFSNAFTPLRIRAQRNITLKGNQLSFLSITGTPACTLWANGTILARNASISNCIALAGKKAKAVNCSNSGNAVNWQFTSTPQPVSLLYGQRGNKCAKIKWTQSVEPDFLFYAIYAFTKNGSPVAIDSVFTQSDTSFTIYDLQNDVPATFAISATDSSGRESALSNKCTVVPDSGLLNYSAQDFVFGPVKFGSFHDTVLVVSNDGTDTISILSVDKTSKSFSQTLKPMRIPPKAFAADTIRYSPSRSGKDSCSIFIATDSKSVPDTIRINGSVIASEAIQPGQKDLPTEFSFQELSTSERTVIFKYSLPVSCFVTMEIYNAIGRTLERPLDTYLEPSTFEFSWNSPQLSRGIYFCRFKAFDKNSSENKFIKTLRIVFSK